jgi:WhiB family transcriptional regulator, redox-sensing transcriptional regulator
MRSSWGSMDTYCSVRRSVPRLLLPFSNPARERRSGRAGHPLCHLADGPLGTSPRQTGVPGGARVFDSVRAVPDLLRRGHAYSDEVSALGELLEMLARGRPGWHRHAACRTADPTISWFVARGEDPRPALAVCSTCPVRDQCLRAGENEPDGLWGGSSPGQRRAMKPTARTVRSTDWDAVPAGVLDRCRPVDPDAA